MKILIYAFILLAGAHSLAAAEIPPWHVIKASERGARLIKIVEAFYEYQSKFGESPPTLYALASKGFLKEEDLCLRNPDKSLTVPDYFPDLTAKSRVDSVVVRAPSEDRSYEIVVRLDLSITGQENRKPAEQAAGGNGGQAR
jgi:hypothetical protein